MALEGSVTRARNFRWRRSTRAGRAGTQQMPKKRAVGRGKRRAAQVPEAISEIPTSASDFGVAVRANGALTVSNEITKKSARNPLAI